MVDVCITLIVVMVSQVSAHVQTHQIVYITCVQVLVDQLYLSHAV